MRNRLVLSSSNTRVARCRADKLGDLVEGLQLKILGGGAIGAADHGFVNPVMAVRAGQISAAPGRLIC